MYVCMYVYIYIYIYIRKWGVWEGWRAQMGKSINQGFNYTRNPLRLDLKRNFMGSEGVYIKSEIFSSFLSSI